MSFSMFLCNFFANSATISVKINHWPETHNNKSHYLQLFCSLAYCSIFHPITSLFLSVFLLKIDLGFVMKSIWGRRVISGRFYVVGSGLIGFFFFFFFWV